jgi:hypothetical protein
VHIIVLCLTRVQQEQAKHELLLAVLQLFATFSHAFTRAALLIWTRQRHADGQQLLQLHLSSSMQGHNMQHGARTQLNMCLSATTTLAVPRQLGSAA